MIAELVHPDTGEKYTVDIPSLTYEHLDRMKKEYADDQQIKGYIDSLPVSAEIKALLFRITKFTIAVGGVVVRIGKRLLEITMLLVKKYPHAGLGLVLGALIASLMAAIPLLGAALAAFLGPLLMLFGLAKGLWEDVRAEEPKLAGDILSAGEAFQPLGA
ncbi:MAG: hypothetical protein AAF662_03115 [Pseudomonadota bacterium]